MINNGTILGHALLQVLHRTVCMFTSSTFSLYSQIFIYVLLSDFHKKLVCLHFQWKMAEQVLESYAFEHEHTPKELEALDCCRHQREQEQRLEAEEAGLV